MVECAQVIRKANFKMSKQLIYSGKAKDIYTTEDENLIISTYKDQATAFNGVKKEQIAGKGVLNNQISSFIFEKLNAAGVETHFVEKISDTDQQISYLKEETRRINELLKAWFAEIGLKLIDFKLEFGFDKDGKIILADEFSPDNCRLWDADGNHMDKDVFRRGLGELTDVYEIVWEKLQGLK